MFDQKSYTFGSMLKGLISAKGASQKDIARLLNVRQPTISEWINGKSEISLGSIRKFFALCKVDSDVYFGYDELWNLLSATGIEHSKLRELFVENTPLREEEVEWVLRAENPRRVLEEDLELSIYVSHYSETFQRLVREHNESFVGRDFALQRFERFVRERHCGYFPITGQAGVGKTALAAAIADCHDALTFFFSTSLKLTDPIAGLNYLAAKTIVDNDLGSDDFVRRSLPSSIGDSVIWLTKTLESLSEKTTLQSPLVLVLDALDEAEGVLRFPECLPEGVFIVITYRSGYKTPAQPVFRELCGRGVTLDFNSSHQRADIMKYIRSQLDRNVKIHDYLKYANVTRMEFTERLLEASEGNFAYVHYILRDLATGDFRSDGLSLDDLPNGLIGYYQQFWNQMTIDMSEGNWDSWNDLYRPVIGLLSVAGEPVPTDWLAEHLGSDVQEFKDRVLRPWRRLLRRTEKHEDGKMRDYWSFIHASFQEFVASELDLESFHSRIADFYLEAPERLFGHGEYEGDYGLRFLTQHLRLAGMEKKLKSLIEQPEWYRFQRQFDLTGMSYVKDIIWLMNRAECQIRKGNIEYLSDIVAWNLLIGVVLRPLLIRTYENRQIRAPYRERWNPQQVLRGLAEGVQVKVMQTLVWLGNYDTVIKYVNSLTNKVRRYYAYLKLARTFMRIDHLKMTVQCLRLGLKLFDFSDDMTPPYMEEPVGDEFRDNVDELTRWLNQPHIIETTAMREGVGHRQRQTVTREERILDDILRTKGFAQLEYVPWRIGFPSFYIDEEWFDDILPYFCEVAVCLENGKKEQAADSLRKALSVLTEVPSSEMSVDYPHIVYLVNSLLCQIGGPADWERISRLAKSLPDDPAGFKLAMVFSLSKVWAKSGALKQTRETMVLMDSVTSDILYKREAGLVDVALILARRGHNALARQYLGKAMETLLKRALDDPVDQVSALVSIADVYMKAYENDLPDGIVAEIIDLLDAFAVEQHGEYHEFLEYQTPALNQVIELLCKVGYIDKARDLLNRIWQGSRKASAWTVVRAYLLAGDNSRAFGVKSTYSELFDDPDDSQKLDSLYRLAALNKARRGDMYFAFLRSQDILDSNMSRDVYFEIIREAIIAGHVTDWCEKSFMSWKASGNQEFEPWICSLICLNVDLNRGYLEKEITIPRENELFDAFCTYRFHRWEEDCDVRRVPITENMIEHLSADNDDTNVSIESRLTERYVVNEKNLAIELVTGLSEARKRGLADLWRFIGSHAPEFCRLGLLRSVWERFLAIESTYSTGLE